MNRPSVEEVVKYIQKHTWRQTSEHFGISEMTISRYIKKFNLVNHINNIDYVNKLKKGFNKLLKKSILDMTAVELKMIYYLLSGKSISLRKQQYVPKIVKIAGVKKFVQF